MKSNVKKEELSKDNIKKEILNKLLKKLLDQKISSLEKKHKIETKNIIELSNISQNLIFSLESLSNNVRKQIYSKRQKLLNNGNKLTKKIKIPYKADNIKSLQKTHNPQKLSKVNRIKTKSFDKFVKGCIDDISIATNREDIDHVKDLIQSSLVLKNVINDENSYRIAYRGQYAIDTTVCKFNDWKSNLKENYNDDLPYDDMNKVIRSDKAGLIMFYGMPGTGKTSLVKSLINDNRDTNFIFVDTSVCESISDGLFLDFLQDNKNSVIVFEDCEKLLFSRDEMVNESIGTILNLTDGIIAESMKIKFICTFNCDLEKVDKALMRKGRLSLGYEIKK